MNANEMVKALHVLCGFDGKSCSGNCAACPADQFRKQHPSGACDDGTMTAAFALIESLQAQLTASQRRADAAVEDMKRIVDKVRETHCDDTCCFACKYDADFSITEAGDFANECPGFDTNECFEWRVPSEAEEGEDHENR